MSKAKALNERGRVWFRVLAALIAIGGVGVALMAPAWCFDLVLARFIGVGGEAHTTWSQRIIAVIGALLAGLSIAVYSEWPRITFAPVKRWQLTLALLPLVILVATNLTYAGAWFHLWRWPPRPALWFENALACALIVGSLPVLLPRDLGAWRESRLWLASGTGLAYGMFSALWHCCPPLWHGGASSNTLFETLWIFGLTLAIGTVGRLSASLPFVRGEVLGGVAFAFVYPWHTPLWFVQCCIAGAFVTAMVRITRSGLAPTVFLACAYVSHMSLPFLGFGGVVIAALIFFVHLAAARSNAH